MAHRTTYRVGVPNEPTPLVPDFRNGRTAYQFPFRVPERTPIHVTMFRPFLSDGVAVVEVCRRLVEVRWLWCWRKRESEKRVVVFYNQILIFV
ncbi:hypothetical protein Hanom_Chr04g00293231 [Helianthus anomalus]